MWNTPPSGDVQFWTVAALEQALTLTTPLTSEPERAARLAKGPPALGVSASLFPVRPPDGPREVHRVAPGRLRGPPRGDALDGIPAVLPPGPPAALEALWGSRAGAPAAVHPTAFVPGDRESHAGLTDWPGRSMRR